MYGEYNKPPIIGRSSSWTGRGVPTNAPPPRPGIPSSRFASGLLRLAEAASGTTKVRPARPYTRPR